MEQRENDADALAISPIRAAPVATVKANEKQNQQPQEAKKGKTKQSGLRPRGNMPTLPAVPPAQKAAAASKAEPAIAKKPSGAARQNVPDLREAAVHQNASLTDSDHTDETAQSVPVAESGFQITGSHNQMLAAGDGGSLENQENVDPELVAQVSDYLIKQRSLHASGADGSSGASPQSPQAFGQEIHAHSASVHVAAAQVRSVVALPPLPFAEVSGTANDAFPQGSSTPSSSSSATRTKKHEELFRGSLAAKPATALPGIGHVAGMTLKENGVYTVRETALLVTDTLYSYIVHSTLVFSRNDERK